MGGGCGGYFFPTVVRGILDVRGSCITYGLYVCKAVALRMNAVEQGWRKER